MLPIAFMLILGIFFAGYLTNIPAFFVFGALFALVLFINTKEKNMKKRCVFAFLGIAVYALGGLYSYSYQKNLFKKANAYASSERKYIIGTVTDDISTFSSGANLILKTKSGVLIKLKCYTEENFLPGDIVCVYNPNLEVLNGNNRLISKYTRLMGKNTLISAVCYNNQASKRGVDKNYKIPRYFYELRKETFASLVKYLDFQDAAFAYSVISSDKTYMSSETYSNFISAGLIHLSSVSGFHFVFLCGVLMYLSLLFSPYYRRRIAFVIALSFVFMLYVGEGISVVRAFVMFAGTQIGDLFYSKRFKSSTCLVFATVLLMVQNPMCVFNNSFLLSFGATYGIIFLNKDVTSFLNRKLLIKIFAVNFSVTVFTLPIIYAIFGRITVFSAFSNFAVDGVVGTMMVLSFLLWGADVFCQPLCIIISPVLKIILKYIFFVVKLIAKIEVVKITGAFSVACAVFLSGMLIFLIKYLRNIKSVRLFATLCIFAVAFASSYAMQYYDNNAYATFIGNSKKVSADIIKKHRHIVVSNADEFFYNRTNSSVKQNEVIDVFILTDTEIENLSLVDFLEEYKIKKIVCCDSVAEKLNKKKKLKSEIYCFEDFSQENIKLEVNDGQLICTEITMNGKKILVTDNYDCLLEKSDNTDNCTILFSGTNKYLKEAKNIEFNSNVNLLCSDSSALATLAETR